MPPHTTFFFLSYDGNLLACGALCFLPSYLPHRPVSYRKSILSSLRKLHRRLYFRYTSRSLRDLVFVFNVATLLTRSRPEMPVYAGRSMDESKRTLNGDCNVHYMIIFLVPYIFNRIPSMLTTRYIGGLRGPINQIDTQFAREDLRKIRILDHIQSFTARIVPLQRANHLCIHIRGIIQVGWWTSAGRRK